MKLTVKDKEFLERLWIQLSLFNRAPAAMPDWSVRPSITLVRNAVELFLPDSFLMKGSSIRLTFGR